MENSDLSDMETNVEPPVEAVVCYIDSISSFVKRKKRKGDTKKEKICTKLCLLYYGTFRTILTKSSGKERALISYGVELES